MFSVWQQQSFINPADVIIVGAGLTGLLTSIKLKRSRPSLTVRILEKGSWPEGASVKNAGFACFGSISEILDDITHEGESAAFGRVINRWRGLQELIPLSGARNIDLKRNGGHEVFTENEKELQKFCEEAIPEINDVLKDEIGFMPYSLKKQSLGMNVLPIMIAIEQEATLHSGKLIRQLLVQAASLGVEFTFGFEVKKFSKHADGWEVISENQSLRCAQLVFATNGFTSSLLDHSKIVPARGQIVLTGKIANLQLKGSFHLHQGYFYFRDFEGGILLGGGRHLDRENEKTHSQECSDQIQQALMFLLNKTILPGQKVQIKQRWAGTMAFGPSNEKDPIVEKSPEGYYVAARLGGMGVAMSPIVAGELAELLLKG